MDHIIAKPKEKGEEFFSCFVCVLGFLESVKKKMFLLLFMCLGFLNLRSGVESVKEEEEDFIVCLCAHVS